MEQLNIFISVGGTANNIQENFVSAIENRIRSENLIPNTVEETNLQPTHP